MHAMINASGLNAVRGRTIVANMMEQQGAHTIILCSERQLVGGYTVTVIVQRLVKLCFCLHIPISSTRGRCGMLRRQVAFQRAWVTIERISRIDRSRCTHGVGKYGKANTIFGRPEGESRERTTRVELVGGHPAFYLTRYFSEVVC